MKTLSIYAALLFSMFTVNYSSAQTPIQKETLKVWGNCSMCKTNIEKAAKKAGATAASWNEETKELKVSYAADKTSSQKIQQAIAKSGYDTQDFSANNNAYKKLPACCKYDRKEAVAKTYCCPMHPEVTSNQPGKCSKCGMDLNLSKKEEMKMGSMYSCPMHPDVTSNESGKCPKCGMNLAKADKDGKNKEAMYSCPMHPEVKGKEPGKCSKCGMDLTLSKKEQMKSEVMKMYSCPMHADVTSDKPGKCSKCGMDLKNNK
jgi:transcription initiation factor IIE alpha subunit